jgi:hypothetical protein
MKHARDGIFKSNATESSRSMSDSGNRTMMARLLLFKISSSRLKQASGDVTRYLASRAAQLAALEVRELTFLSLDLDLREIRILQP